MGVLGVSVGAGLAAVTLLTVPVFVPALQPRALQASPEQLSLTSRTCLCHMWTDLRRLLLLTADHGAWSKQAGWGKSRMEAVQRCLCAPHLM